MLNTSSFSGELGLCPALRSVRRFWGMTARCSYRNHQVWRGTYRGNQTHHQHPLVQMQHPKPLSQLKNKRKACGAASQQLVGAETDPSATMDGAGDGLGTVWTGGSQPPNFKPLLTKQRCEREWEGTRAAAWFLGSRSGCPRALSSPHRGHGAGEPRRGAPGGTMCPPGHWEGRGGAGRGSSRHGDNTALEGAERFPLPP